MTATMATAVACMMILLAGCSFGRGGSCHKEQEYQRSRIGQQLVIPDDLAPLDPADGLQIPPGPRATEPVPKGTPCFEQPPDYLLDRDTPSAS